MFALADRDRGPQRILRATSREAALDKRSSASSPNRMHQPAPQNPGGRSARTESRPPRCRPLARTDRLGRSNRRDRSAFGSPSVEPSPCRFLCTSSRSTNRRVRRSTAAVSLLDSARSRLRETFRSRRALAAAREFRQVVIDEIDHARGPGREPFVSAPAVRLGQDRVCGSEAVPVALAGSDEGGSRPRKPRFRRGIVGHVRDAQPVADPRLIR